MRNRGYKTFGLRHPRLRIVIGKDVYSKEGTYSVSACAMRWILNVVKDQVIGVSRDTRK